MSSSARNILIRAIAVLGAGVLAAGCGDDKPTPRKQDTGVAPGEVDTGTPAPTPDAAKPADAAATPDTSVPSDVAAGDTATGDGGATDVATTDVAATDAALDVAGSDLGVTVDMAVATDATASTDGPKAMSAIPTTAQQLAYQPTYSVETLPMVKGLAAMEFLHSNQLVAMATAAGAGRNFKMVGMPKQTGGGSSVYIKPSQYFSITSNAKHPKEAALFIDFFTNSIEANDILAAERGVPVNSKVLAALKPKLSKTAQESFDLVDRLKGNARALPMPDPPQWDSILKMTYTPHVIDPVLNGNGVAETQTALFRSMANIILAGGTVVDGGVPPPDATAPAADAGADATATADATGADATAADATGADATAADATAAADTAPDTAPAADTAPTPVTLTIAWWGSQDRHTRTTAVIDLFKKKYPHITVFVQYATSTEYWPMMRNQGAAGTLPDVMQQDHAYIEEFAAKGWIIALDDLVTSASLNLTDVPKALIDGGRFNGGKLYGVNLGSNTQGIVLDVDAFAKAGITLPTDDWTWTEFETIAKGLYTKLGVWGYGIGLHSYTPWKSLYLSAGGWVFNPTNTAIGYSDDTPWVNHLKMMKRLQTP
jgi:ABC-type glycerol-3-phosphate transport system substrate-binding protein